MEEYVNFMSKLIDETNRYDLLQSVFKLVNTNKWKHVIDKRIQSFKNFYYKMTVRNDGLLLHNTRLVMPEALQKEAIMIIHESHQVMTITKRLVRSKV